MDSPSSSGKPPKGLIRRTQWRSSTRYLGSRSVNRGLSMGRDSPRRASRRSWAVRPASSWSERERPDKSPSHRPLKQTNRGFRRHDRTQRRRINTTTTDSP
ncbi:hypothetical protein AXF42_Ash019185 [Apostasia shenzhenica]|uniref:Uncharacterized protein n=1 Tax=Apostasia shenzhenica TaxID=1088818 RepID=A0A2I0B2G0_9ASPA|nr:hypothetical protein AXF42_Ash019185 [Apostasia shenzhenica]